jgi:predicted protein tyrosine phosphatase
VSSANLAWADVIFVMEEKHKSRLLAEHHPVIAGKTIHVLDIPDDYRYRARSWRRSCKRRWATFLGCSSAGRIRCLVTTFGKQTY